MRHFLKLAASALLLAWAAPAVAQGTCSPPIVYGAVLTAGQWQACFASKQNTLGYAPVNRAGDTMTGKLTTAIPNTSAVGLSLPAGVAPSVPVNGDFWGTNAGLFYRLNGSTLNLSTSAGVTAANVVYAGPASGAAATPTFRSLVSADLTGTFTGITGLGTIGTGTWQGTVISPTYGGTGINNASRTLTLGASLATTGTSATTLAFPSSGTPTYTFPSASKTLMATDWSNGPTLTANAFLTGGGAGTAPSAVAITGLVLGNGASAPTAYAGVSCAANNWLSALSASGTSTCNPSTVPTRTIYLTGSGTYTVPSGVRQLRVREWAGGAGGGGNSSGNLAVATAGGNTSFNSISVVGGGVGATFQAAGAGGTGGSGTASFRVAGQGGEPGVSFSANYSFTPPGGIGGGSHMGPGGVAGGGPVSTGGNAPANTGGGGGGAAGINGGPMNSFGGGGGGEYAEIIISSPSASYPYSVGAGGAGGSGSTYVGGNGSNGGIIIEELY